MRFLILSLKGVLKTCLDKWDSSGNGIIENAGFPDQTYDMWKSQGTCKAVHFVKPLLAHMWEAFG